MSLPDFPSYYRAFFVCFTKEWNELIAFQKTIGNNYGLLIQNKTTQFCFSMPKIKNGISRGELKV